MDIATFTFNPFSENTYVLYDETKDCIIVDPGCYTEEEQTQLTDFIAQHALVPVHLVNTHCHIDHVLGNKFVSDRYGLFLTSHAGEQVVLDAQPTVSQMYGISYLRSPDIKVFLAQDDILTFGNTSLKVLFTPGHSPASISLYNHESMQLIAGDVLFDGSIGRTDLPGGDFKTLIDSITTQLLKLDDKVVVYSGHGEITTIGKERRSNPFLT